MGNVHERTIEEIWHGKGFEYYRKMHLKKRGAEIELCQGLSRLEISLLETQLLEDCEERGEEEEITSSNDWTFRNRKDA